ncbi:MAG TPA: BBE domain-containing protein, partial [Thermodesulfobacteriota bacterium]|nr:BBE domain-containing protein [Thermodesulfobacteriota bacterium]
VYVNFLSDDEASRVRSAYGKNFDRLAEVKRKYDPDNFFHMNQNVKPAGKESGTKERSSVDRGKPEIIACGPEGCR